ncbi:tetratricopeptide repeat protein [Lignipirellula cremea]|uniref:Anaphase-promoting complex, cyclosome, subunit 3 n=1 Tax=Lignipirellula cremea TaxID=2528010 RepID=A0A518DYN6_9BACT|nr:surface lipoprotein assembly modifier [Lignipirellula cremea]QDU96956.1 Anaphase-promoting complex, cyclosome, subunit 3 [Lignipirellula cremea]
MTSFPQQLLTTRCSAVLLIGLGLGFALCASVAQAQRTDLFFPPLPGGVDVPESPGPRPELLRLPDPEPDFENRALAPVPQNQAAAADPLADYEQRARQVLASDPQNEEALLLLANIFKKRKQADQALSLLLEAHRRDPGQLTIAIAVGRCYLEKQAWEEAECMFAHVASIDPQYPDLQFWLANVQLREGNPLTAYRLLQTPGNVSHESVLQHQLLLRGQACHQLGLANEAACCFRQAASGTDKEAVQEAEALQEQLDEILQWEGRWTVDVQGFLRYDTNPGIVPTANVLGIPTRPEPSLVDQLDGSVSYDLLRGNNRALSINYAFLRTDVFSAERFNISDNAAQLGYRHQTMVGDSTPLQFFAGLDVDHLEVGLNPFLRRYGANLATTAVLSDWFAVTTTVSYSRIDYLNQDFLEGTPLDADSDFGNAGVLLVKRMDEIPLTFQAGLFLSRNLSQGGNLDFFGQQMQLGAAWAPECTDWEFNLLASVEHRQFDNRDFFFGVKRHDWEPRIQFLAVYPLSDDWSITAGCSWDRNYSNLITSDFDRQTYQIGLHYGARCQVPLSPVSH